jgi:hypothetical protein
MAAALQQQQLKNEITKMAMRVPWFYGNEMTPRTSLPDSSQLVQQCFSIFFSTRNTFGRQNP